MHQPVLIFILNHTVSNTDFGKNIFWLCRIQFQFTSNVCHVYPEYPIIIVRIRSPDTGNDGIISHDSAGVLCQESNDFEFYLRQMCFFSTYCNEMLRKINGQFPGMIDIMRAGRGQAVAVPLCCSNTCQKYHVPVFWRR